MKRPAIPILLVVGLLAIVGLAVRSVRPRRMVRVSHADSALQAASREAQRTLSTFDAELERGIEGTRAAIKAKFPTPSGPEYLWVRDPKLGEPGYVGIVDQEPLAAKTVHKGDTVTVKKADVYDWMLRTPDGKTRGGFTERVLSGGE